MMTREEWKAEVRRQVGCHGDESCIYGDGSSADDSDTLREMAAEVRSQMVAEAKAAGSDAEPDEEAVWMRLYELEEEADQASEWHTVEPVDTEAIAAKAASSVARLRKISARPDSGPLNGATVSWIAHRHFGVRRPIALDYFPRNRREFLQGFCAAKAMRPLERHTIAVREQRDAAASLRLLAHELAHAAQVERAERAGVTDWPAWADRNRAALEAEAERRAAEDWPSLIPAISDPAARERLEREHDDEYWDMVNGGLV